MAAIFDLFEQAQLALASYARSLQPGMLGEAFPGYVPSLAGEPRMSETQAKAFANSYAVVHQVTSSDSGFSATVFEKDGIKYFAIRGTEGFDFAGRSDWLTNVNGIRDEGIAVDQAVDLVNYLQRLYAPDGAPVVQYTYNSIVKTFGTTLGTGLGLLTGSFPLTVAGHSLGGHLAMIMSRAAPGKVNSVYTFNAPGFDTSLTTTPFPLTSDGFFNGLRNTGLAPETGHIGITWDNQRMTHVVVPGDAVSEIGTVPAYPPQIVFTETANQGPLDAHSVGEIVDSLAIHVLFADVDPGLNTLDPAVGIAKISGILSATSNNPARSLEESLDSLRRIFRDAASSVPAATPTGDRERFYVNLNEAGFRDRVDSSNGALSIESLVAADVETLRSFASDPSGIAYRYALRALNPFAVLGPDSVYAPHNSDGELNLYVDANTTPGGMTEQYITDRAEFLAKNNTANIADVTTILDPNYVAGERMRFTDRPSEHTVTISNAVLPPIDDTTKRFVFGGDGPDFVSGGSLTDRLYGGLGADVLFAGKSNDYLEGGAGRDVYHYSADTKLFDPTNDGDDEIRDTDGKGLIRYTFQPGVFDPVQSRVIGGAAIQVDQTTWQSPDGKFTYRRQGPDILISINGDAGGSIYLRSFDYAQAESTGYFGIRLIDGLPSTPQNPVRTFYGDKQNWDSNPATPEIEAVTDAYGNEVRSDGQAGRPDVPQLNRPDTFYGSPADDVERFETAGGDDVVHADGPNSVTSTFGGRDLVLTGNGSDVVVAGAGDDWVEGGPGDDLLGGGYGDDVIWAGAAGINGAPITLAQAITTGSGGGPLLGQGDLLTGDDGADWLFGTATADLISGGMDEDLIVGGAGNDNIYGDASIITADFRWASTRIETLEGETKIYRVQATGYTLIGDGPAQPGAADVIYGGAGADWIFAGAGDDYVEGGEGSNVEDVTDDVIFGEAGDDILIGGSGADMLHGDAASVDAAGLSGDDYLDGGPGNDLLFGGGGADILFGGDGADAIHGNDGDDILVGERGGDSLFGGAGKDVYVYYRGDGRDRVKDPDITKASEYLSSVVVGPGISKSEVKFRLASLAIDFGDGDELHFEDFDPDDPTAIQPFESIRFADGEVMTFDDVLAQGFDLDGTPEDDYIQGTAVTDRIDAGAGNDVVFGKAGDDVIFGGEGDDEIIAGDGDDVVDAGAGNDLVKGGAGNDTILGGEGDDLLLGGAGDDQLAGGAGTDTYFLVGGIGVDRVTDGEAGEENVIDLAGLPIETLVIADAGEDLRIGLRGLDDAVVITDYHARAQDWVIRGTEGEVALDEILGGPEPEPSDAVGALWNEVKYAGLATTFGQAHAIGWTSLGGGRFQPFVEEAWLDYNAQTTTTTYYRVDPPHEQLAQFTEQTGGQIEVQGFDSRSSALFRNTTITLASGRQETDAGFVTGMPTESPGQNITYGQALLTLRDHPPTINQQHTIWSESGAIVSYDTGVEVVLAAVTYEYDVSHWNRFATVTAIAEAPETWSHPLNIVAGNRVLVDEQRIDSGRLAVNEIIGGASANTIVVPSPDPLSNLTFTTLVDGGAGNDVIIGGALAYGNAGDDDLSGAGILIGGDGDDRLWGDAGARFFFTAEEYGIDTVDASASAARAYLDWYYARLGIADWERSLTHGGEYHLDPFEGEGWYFPTLAQAEAWRDNFGYGEITYIEPLTSIAPVVTRNDVATLDTLAAAGVLSRETVEFAAGLRIDDLSLVVRVPGGSAEAHPEQPWYDGGTLRVRWNEGESGFDIAIPDVRFGFEGESLLAQVSEGEEGPVYGWETYRFGEGVEAFRFADGTSFALEDVLRRATVVPDYGEFFFRRAPGEQTISRFNSAIVFDSDIWFEQIQFGRDGLDLTFRLWDGGGEGRIPDWYADPVARPLLEMRFADGTVIGEAEITWSGLYVVGTDGDDVMTGLEVFGDLLDGDRGNDILDGLSGDDRLYGGEGNDIAYGGAGNDEVESWGEGSNFIDLGTGDDYAYTEGRAFVIGGEGDDWIEFYGDGGVVAFNPGDGNDTVYVAGSLTLSLGGGITGEDLWLREVDALYMPGAKDVLVSVGEAGSIRLTRQWEDDPTAWPEITLQLFGSVHRFAFNPIIDALTTQSGGDPGFVLVLGELLEAHRIEVSETAGVGGALAWQYATAGSVEALSIDEIRSLLADPEFGFAPQPIELSPENRAPILALPIADQSILEDAPFSLSVADAFADPDEGDVLIFNVSLADGSPLPSWLAFDAASATFSGFPGNDDVGLLEITVSASDEAGETVSDLFSLEVVNVNDAPVASDDSGTALEDGGPVTLSAASLLANDIDIDAGDVLSIVGVTRSAAGASVSLVAGDVVYDPSGLFQSLAAGGQAFDSFDYTVADLAGETSTASIAMTITGVNDAPMLVAPIAAQAGREGEALGFSVEGAFADVDAGDTLAYTATLADGSALPAWLAFDAQSGGFSGTPGAGDAGAYVIRLAATDLAGEAAQTDISVEVAAAPPPPPPPPPDPGDGGGHGHGHGKGKGWHHGHDHDGDHPGRGKGHHKDWKHARGDEDRDDDRHEGVAKRFGKKHKFDFDALLAEFDRNDKRGAPSKSDIRHGWQKVADFAARLGAGDDDAAHGMLWRGAKDFGRLVAGGGHAFGFDGSTGAGRSGEDFKCFEGLREGFRRL